MACSCGCDWRAVGASISRITRRVRAATHCPLTPASHPCRRTLSLSLSVQFFYSGTSVYGVRFRGLRMPCFFFYLDRSIPRSILLRLDLAWNSLYPFLGTSNIFQRKQSEGVFVPSLSSSGAGGTNGVQVSWPLCLLRGCRPDCRRSGGVRCTYVAERDGSQQKRARPATASVPVPVPAARPHKRSTACCAFVPLRRPRLPPILPCSSIKSLARVCVCKPLTLLRAARAAPITDACKHGEPGSFSGIHCTVHTPGSTAPTQHSSYSYQLESRRRRRRRPCLERSVTVLLCLFKFLENFIKLFKFSVISNRVAHT
jgi:hypothetical protein